MRYLSKATLDTEKEPVPFRRSSVESGRMNVTNVTRTEHTPGNMALQRALKTGYLRAKLRVGSSTDPLEREADLTADAIMRMPEAHPRPKPGAAVERFVQANRASGATELTDSAQVRIDALRGSGRPLGPAEKEFFEPRFGSDFSGVRLHTDSGAAELANMVRARAFTVGQNIFFAAGESPGPTGNSRRLLAHELTHVAQQGYAASEGRSGPSALLQREPDSSSTAPQAQTIEPATQSSWRVRVDAAIRAQFGLVGSGMTAGRVRFMEPAAFVARFPDSETEDLLLDMFLSPPMGTHFRDVLRHHRMELVASGPTAISSLRRFISERMRIGYFEYTRFAPPVPARTGMLGEAIPADPEERTTVMITPGELLAEAVAGVTTTAGPRAERRVAVSMPANVETLMHEGCHFYVHSAFRWFANSARYQDRVFRGLRMSSILMEGFAEYFTRQVMRANAADFGPIAIKAYDEEVDLVSRFVTTLGEAQARQAYFDGNAAALSQLYRAIELSVQAYPLLVPGFMLSAPVTAVP